MEGFGNGIGGGFDWITGGEDYITEGELPRSGSKGGITNEGMGV